MNSKINIGVIGAGTMGRGIAQIAAQAGHKVVLCDSNDEALSAAKTDLENILRRLESKNRLDGKTAAVVLANIHFYKSVDECRNCGMIIEAIVENLSLKQQLFQSLEKIAPADTILASNTSSLSIAAIAGKCVQPERILGIHFFNPAPLMPLVEIVPGIQTTKSYVEKAKLIVESWGKTTVIARDTPGFIVNRVARPFYGEALRILEEGIADVATIDWAMKSIGGFRMGPFELMDLIGNDINFTVTKTVFETFFFDPRYKPSFTQQRMMEAGLLGRKTGRGFYDYRENATQTAPKTDREIGVMIVNRILAMLINEAADALFWQIATCEDIDLAMTKGVNYPKGLLKWADEIGLDIVLRRLENLHVEYSEDRYRPSPILRRMVKSKQSFYDDRSQ
ncbi:MAG: NAD(P)-binding domain-containing protein [Calditrichaeota bacterium]|nr:NAD(P)-binding domain-containing protein [Calditrichota bacterium]